MREELIKRLIIYIYDEDNGKIMLENHSMEYLGLIYDNYMPSCRNTYQGLSDEEILNILEQQKVETLAKMKGNGRK